MSSERACDGCLARSWLLTRIAGHLEQVRHRIERVLRLDNEDLLAAVGGRRRGELEEEFRTLDVTTIRSQLRAVGLESICSCDPAYPSRLGVLASAPWALHVAGGLDRFLRLACDDVVAVVGARRASPYGLEVARALGRGLASAGLTVLSGMAVGIDSAAHGGALEPGGHTVAVLPRGADRPYPADRCALYRRIVSSGAAVSELLPGSTVRRWMFPARNRIVAALAAMTVVVEAGERSGSLVTAQYARELGLPVGAVPGRVTSSQAAGPNELLAAGAGVIRGPQDVLDQIYGSGVRGAGGDQRSELSGELQALLEAVAAGRDTAAALARAGLPAQRGLAALAALELAGYVRREPGGRFSVLP